MQNMLEKQIGNYRITAEIAAGTFGSVYIAKHLVFDDEPAVAVKLLHTHLGSEKERERFLQEARFLRKLKHQYILPLLDAGVYEGFLFFIVEYASSGSLHDRLCHQPSRPLHIGEALTILSQTAQALQYAHSQNIVHRDLKPANILFNTKGEALLADFGIAVILERTKRVEVEGTPPYMAPEQFQGEVSKRSDQYALGCIAYELFTGQRPFIAPDFFSMGYKHVHEQPISPTQLNPNLPEYIEQAILKAMSKQRQDRYSDISAFIAALQMALEPTVIEKSLDSGKSREDWLKEGDTFRYHRQYQKALEAYERVIRFDLNDAIAHKNKGCALYGLGRYKEAVESFEWAVRLDPNDARAHDSSIYSLSKYYEALEEALEAYEEAIRLDPPNNPMVYLKNICMLNNNLGRYEKALEACEQAIRLDPNDAVAYTKGVVLHNLGRYEEALEAYEEAIRLDPNNARAHRYKGYALEKLGRYEEAIRLDRAGDAVAYNTKGDALKELRRYKEAIKAYEEAICLDPNNARAHSTKGDALKELRRYKEAIKAYEEAIRLDPNNARTHSTKGDALDKLGRYEEAIKAYEEAIRLDPNNARAHNNKGLALEKLRRYEEAIKAYEEAIRLDPNNVRAHNNKGYVLEKLRRYEEAIKAYEEAIRFDPNFTPARNNKDVALKELKKATQRWWHWG